MESQPQTIIENATKNAVLTYHGNIDHFFWIYKQSDSPPNLYKWDFSDKPEFVCTNHKHEGNNQYQCLGHEDGDFYYPTYHGDVERNHNFWIYPSDKPLVNEKWDFYSLPCNHCESIKGQPSDRHVEFRCLGHHKTYHKNGQKCSGQDQCPGHSTYTEEVSYHGNPDCENKFWIYPKKKDIVTPRWDFRINPCHNSKKTSGMFSTLTEYQCLGHNSMQHAVQMKENNNLLMKIGIGIGVALAATVVVAGAVVAVKVLTQDDHKPCKQCAEILAIQNADLFTQEEQESEEKLEKKKQFYIERRKDCKCSHKKACDEKITATYTLLALKLKKQLDLKQQYEMVSQQILTLEKKSDILNQQYQQLENERRHCNGLREKYKRNIQQYNQACDMHNDVVNKMNVLSFKQKKLETYLQSKKETRQFLTLQMQLASIKKQ